MILIPILISTSFSICFKLQRLFAATGTRIGWWLQDSFTIWEKCFVCSANLNGLLSADTFPVGCAYSDKIVYPDFFQANPDFSDVRFISKYGVYSPNCGLKNVHMSWGHDEYIYSMLAKDYLPEPAIIHAGRYHSFYSQHRENAYTHLMDEHDHEMFKWVKLFNPYDLYSKNPEPPDWTKLKPYYEELVAKYLPATLNF